VIQTPIECELLETVDALKVSSVDSFSKWPDKALRKSEWFSSALRAPIDRKPLNAGTAE